jgi:hypothetical protein
MSENEDLKVQISRLLEHIKIRPTHVVLNTVYITLKNYGYRDIPRIQYPESVGVIGSNVIDRKIILNYCKEIEKLVETDPENEDSRKKNSTKEIHIFQESTMLPQNVYVSEKGDEEKVEDNYVEEDVTTASETENSANSELEEQEEGYEIYEENDSEEFSD